MQFHLPSQQAYDCLQCGRSCQAGWDIPVEEEVRQTLENHPLTLRVIQERGAALVPKKHEWVLNMNPQQPRCGFLEPDLLCGLHKELGPEAKPHTCRLFPYILSETPEGLFVGVSYSCSAARSNAGRPLSEQQADIEGLLKVGVAVNRIPSDGLPLHGSWFVSWTEYRNLEKLLLEQALQKGWQPAIADLLLGLAAQIALWPRPRNTSPRPAPASTPLAGPHAGHLLSSLRKEMWRLLAPSFPSDLAGVEPATRSDYQALNPDWEAGFRLDNSEVDRYLEHIVFRKQLVIHPTLLGNLCLLDFLPDFLGCYAQAFARHRQRPLSQQDYWDALDLAEKFLVYHCRGLRPIYQKAARHLVSLLQGEESS